MNPVNVARTIAGLLAALSVGAYAGAQITGRKSVNERGGVTQAQPSPPPEDLFGTSPASPAPPPSQGAAESAARAQDIANGLMLGYSLLFQQRDETISDQPDYSFEEHVEEQRQAAIAEQLRLAEERRVAEELRLARERAQLQSSSAVTSGWRSWFQNTRSERFGEIIDVAYQIGAETVETLADEIVGQVEEGRNPDLKEASKSGIETKSAEITEGLADTIIDAAMGLMPSEDQATVRTYRAVGSWLTLQAETIRESYRELVEEHIAKPIRAFGREDLSP